MSFRIIILYHSLHSCHSSWSHCWWLVWHSGFAAVISWAQVWAVNVWLGEIPQKRDTLRDSASENSLKDVVVARTKGFCGSVFQVEVSSTHCTAKQPLLKQKTGRSLGQALSSGRQLQMEGDQNLKLTPTYKCILHLFWRDKGALLPWSCSRNATLFSVSHGHWCCSQSLVEQCCRFPVAPASPGRSEPHSGPQGEVFPVRDRITPLTHTALSSGLAAQEAHKHRQKTRFVFNQLAEQKWLEVKF